MPQHISVTDALTEILAAVSEDTTLPNPDCLAYYQLLRDRIAYLETDVGEAVIRLHKQILLWNMEDRGIPADRRMPIRIVIMSPGGSVDFMWMLIDAIRASVTPVHTVNIGCAHSSAGLIFMSGARRYMTENATLIIHEGSAELNGDAIKVMDASESYKRMLLQMKDFIAARTAIPKATLARKRSNDWKLSAAECLKYGVCDRIVASLDELLSPAPLSAAPVLTLPKAAEDRAV